MASGRNHQVFNVSVLLAGAVFLGIARYRGWADDFGLAWPAVVAFIASFVVGTYLVTPDLDLAESRVLAKRNWGILGFIWAPYGYLFAHRGWSHGWILGPLTRLSYLLGLAAFGIGISYAAATWFELEPITIEARFDQRWVPALLGGLAGFYTSQWLHLLADGVGPFHELRRVAGKLREL